MGETFFRLSQLRFFSKFKNCFLYSSFLPLFIGMIATISWINNIPLFGLAVIVIIACYVFVTQKDMTPILPMLLSFIMLFRTLDTAYTTPLFIILAPAVVCILIRVFKYRSRPILGRLFFPLVAVSIALALGGIFSPYIENYLFGIASILALGPLLIIIYLFFINFLHPPKAVCLKTYFAKCFVIMVFFACVEFLFFFYHQAILKDTVFIINELGWANVNSIGTLILLALPLSFYLLTKTGKVIRWFLMIIFLIAVAYLTNSSGAMFFGTISIPFLIIYTYYHIPDKIKPLCRCLFFALFIALFMALLILIIRDHTLIINFIVKALSDSGRSELYDEAIKLIKKFPVFGAGMGYYNDKFAHLFGNHKIFNFHSTFYHVFATMGGVGIIAYVYYYATRIKIFTLKITKYSTYAFISFILFGCYGMINPCEFMMMPVVMHVTMIMVIAEVDARKPLLHDHLYTALKDRYI